MIFVAAFVILLQLNFISTYDYYDESKLWQTIYCANSWLVKHLRESKRRVRVGIDSRVEAQPEITPGVLSGAKTDLSRLTLPAKLLNRLNYCRRKVGFKYSLRYILYRRNCYRYYWLPGYIGYSPYYQRWKCDFESKYRTANGQCNNKKNPLWGSAKIPFIRELPPTYKDKALGEPRTKGVGGGDLPGPRSISTKLHSATTNPPTSPVTALYTAFGQFLSHDLTNTPTSHGYRGSLLGCCNEPDREKCFNIDIPVEDSFYTEYNRTCMSFSRSLEGTDLEFKKGEREQVNLATSFIDASPIYGDSKDNWKKLRSYIKGHMISSYPNLFPVKIHQHEKARQKGINLFCAGDPKVNESPHLHSITLIFWRAHNKIAAILSNMNKMWNDETIFLETRRIIIAFVQHITYIEFLPLTLSDHLMHEYDLNCRSEPDYYEGYDPDVNPTIDNVFSTSMMRFGHSLLNNVHTYANSDYEISDKYDLPIVKTFFRPLTYLVRELDVNRGFMASSSENFDRSLVNGVQNKLFETKPGNGMDLSSLNIQRGRDHGLPSYADFRTHFKLRAPTDWSADSFPDLRPEDIQLFRDIYSSPEDIDVWSGAVSEIPVGNKVVGPLVAKSLATTFSRVKKGDRFWYETGEDPQKFTVDQLNLIRSLNMAMMLCFTLDLETVQEHPFAVYDSGLNQRKPCSEFPMIDFSAWAV